MATVPGCPCCQAGNLVDEKEEQFWLLRTGPWRQLWSVPSLAHVLHRAATQRLCLLSAHIGTPVPSDLCDRMAPDCFSLYTSENKDVRHMKVWPTTISIRGPVAP